MTKFASLPVVALVLAIAVVPSALAADISGKWSFTWDTEGGIRHTNWDISQDGNELIVKSDGQTFNGTIEDGKFTVKGRLHSAEAGYASNLKVEGTLREDGTMEGRGSWDLYGMTFTAKRSE